MSKESVNHHVLADLFLRKKYVDDHTQARTLLYDGTFFYRYTGKAYVQVKPAALQDELLLWLATTQGLTATWDRDECWEHVRAILRLGTPLPAGYDPALDGPGHTPNWWIRPASAAERNFAWIAVPNGVLYLGDHEKEPLLVPSSPRWFSEVLLATEYVPGAKCPLWLQSLGEWLPEPKIRDLLQEFSGYLLWPSNLFQVGLFLEGSGCNGKSVFLEVIKRILGKRNVSRVKLENLSTRFNAGMMGKLANIAPETGHKVKIDLGTLKDFLDGTELTFEQKYQESVECKSRSKLMIAWNVRPVIADDTDSTWRRMLLVEFPNSFKGVERHDLEDTLAESEASGILNWMLEGLQRLMRRGRFPEVVEARPTEFQESVNFLPMWIKENLVLSQGSHESKNVVYALYKEASEDAGHEAVDELEFAREVYRLKKGSTYRRIGTLRIPSFFNVKLKGTQ